MQATLSIQNNFIANNGKFVVDCFQAAGGDPGPFEVFVKLLGPGGIVVIDDSSALFPALPVDTQQVETADIPLNADGSYLGGEYYFEVRTTISAVEYVSGATIQYDPKVTLLSNESDDANLTVSYNCVTTELTIVDATIGSGYDSVVTTISHTPPVTSTNPLPSTSTDDDTSRTIVTAIEGLHQVTSVTARQKTLDPLSGDILDIQVLLFETVGVMDTINVQCSNACDAATGFQACYEALYGEGCKTPTTQQRNDFVQKLGLAMIAVLKNQCGVDASEYYQQIASADCGCGCD